MKFNLALAIVSLFAVLSLAGCQDSKKTPTDPAGSNNVTTGG